MSVRPPCDVCIIPKLISDWYGFHNVKVIREMASYDDRNILIEVETNNQQLQRSETGGVEQVNYLVKILNEEDSAQPDKNDARNGIIVYLKEAGYPTPGPLKNVHGGYQSVVELGDSDNDTPGKYILRLFEFAIGISLEKVCLTKSHCRELGQMTGWLDFILKDFPMHKYEIIKTMQVHWNLSETWYLKSKVHYVKDEDRVAMIREIISSFESNVLHSEEDLSEGLIHSDINDCNTVVGKTSLESRLCLKHEKQRGTSCGNCMEGDYTISAIIDFGDLTFGLYIFEVAIALTYVMINDDGLDPMEAAASLLSGYLERNDLPLHELKHLRVCVCIRLIQSYVYGQVAKAEDGDNDYAQTHASRTWPFLDKFWKMSNDQFIQCILK